MRGLAVPAGYRVVALDCVDSTNDELKRRTGAGAAAGTVVWARTQTKGRGRGQRQWQSPVGNLYVSILLRPDCPAAHGAQATFVAALATADAVAASLPAGSAITCKWPNDVLVHGRKVAGILLESGLAPSGRLDWLIVGIGINVAWHPADGEQLLYPATSLRAQGALDVNAEAVLSALIVAFERWRAIWVEDGFAAVRAAWRARAHGLGRPIAVGLDGERVEGVFADLDAGGALLVATADGHMRTILAGDVFPAGG